MQCSTPFSLNNLSNSFQSWFIAVDLPPQFD